MNQNIPASKPDFLTRFVPSWKPCPCQRVFIARLPVSLEQSIAAYAAVAAANGVLKIPIAGHERYSSEIPTLRA